MEISQEYRLNKLGIDIWKKRYQETNLTYNRNYLIEDKYLFCFENKESLFDKSNEVIFFRTLAISLGKEKVSQVSNLDSSLKITNIFLLDTDLPNNLKKYNDSFVSKCSSIQEICSSKENKKDFLSLVKQLVN